MYGLKDLQVGQILSVFSSFKQVEKAILYGSRAKGIHRANSDIDISLIGNDIDLNLLFKIENELDDLLLPYEVDLSIFHKIENQDLIEHIQRVGVNFYEK